MPEYYSGARDEERAAEYRQRLREPMSGYNPDEMNVERKERRACGALLHSVQPSIVAARTGDDAGERR